MTNPKSNNGINIQIGGNVSNSQINAAGRDVVVNQQKSLDLNSIQEAFDEIYKKIEARSLDSDVDNSEIRSVVENIQTEITKGGVANESKIQRWFRFLAEMAPDIFDVVVSTLSNPVLGIREVIRKVSNKTAQKP